MRCCIALVVGFLVLFPIIYTSIESNDTTTVIAKTINVDNTDLAEFNTIQDAIDAADPGDTIFVNNGSYHENLIIDKSIHLIGENKSNTTIDGNSGIAVHISSSDIVIQGFTILDCSHGIMVTTSSNVQIKENTLMNAGYGVYVDDESVNNTIYMNNFKDNTVNAIDLSLNSWWFSSSGNFWDDYNGTDADSNGFGDTPYTIAGGVNKDEYPLMLPLSNEPAAGFTYTPAYATTEDSIIFTDTSFDDEGIIIWSWDFGDGDNSTLKHPEHRFKKSGTYTVSLTVTDPFGLSDTISTNLFIRNNPPHCDFSFSPSRPTDIEDVLFTDTSTDSDGVIMNWTWVFGENITRYEQNVTYQFPDDGTYQVLLIVTDDEKASSSITKYIVVDNVAPTAGFSFYADNISMLIGEPIHFRDSSFDLDGNIVNWSWDLGDGTKTVERNPTHTYSKTGSYSIVLTVIDDDNASNSITKRLTISPIIKEQDWDMGVSTFDIVFIVFILAMVVMVVILTKKYGK
jgi:parallel beta-helix repeat protein